MKNKFLQILFGINLLWSIILLGTGWQSNSSKHYVVITIRYSDEHYYWDNSVQKSITVKNLDEAMNALSQKGYRFEQTCQNELTRY